MNYKEMIHRVEDLGFIRDRETADAACKAVWGILASSVDEETAEEIASELPDPLTKAKLRSHQARRMSIDSEHFIREIGTQFHLQEDQARQLVETVILAGEESLREDSLSKLRENVPQDLSKLLLPIPAGRESVPEATEIPGHRMRLSMRFIRRR
jgi:uncharacterized protein (DUF2267 family)